MAVGVPIGECKMMKLGGRKRPARLWVKVSHHGHWRKRWQPTEKHPVPIQQVLQHRPIQRKRRLNQSKAVKVSNSQRARIERSHTIRRGMHYAIIHGCPTNLTAVEAMECKPVGLIVMVPARTKHQAELIALRSEFDGIRFELVRGAKLVNAEGAIVLFPGYHRYVPDDGQAWIQKRTLAKLKVGIPKLEGESDGSSSTTECIEPEQTE